MAVKKIILLVDDDAKIVETVGDRLRFEGFHVMPAYSAEEGLRLLAKRRIDLIVLDIGMPGMNGLTFLNQVVSGGTARPRILVFTARDNVADFRDHPAVDAAVPKTSNPGELIATVRRLLGEVAAEGDAPAVRPDAK